MIRYTIGIPLLLLAALLGLSQCTTPGSAEATEGPPILANVYVRYLVDEAQLTGEATFYRGDSLPNAQPLAFDAGVAFMGSGMKAVDLPGVATRYRATIPGQLPSPLRFSFSETPNQDPRVISIDFQPPGTVQIEPGPTLAKGIYFVVDTALAADESMLFLLSAPDNQTFPILMEGPTTHGRLWAPAPAVAHLAAGEYQVSWVFKKTIQQDSPGLKTTGVAEYYGGGRIPIALNP